MIQLQYCKECHEVFQLPVAQSAKVQHTCGK